MRRRFNPPPDWPSPPGDWLPPNGWKPDPEWTPAPPGWKFWVDEVTPKDAAIRVMTLVVVSAAAYALPLYGLPISLCLPILAVSFRQQLWEGSTRRLCLLCGVLAWVGMWWPAIVGFVTGWVLGAAEPISTAWLLIPLCGPDGPGVIALPALVAGLVNATGLVASVVARQPWLWVAAAWVAPWAHHLVLAALPHQYIC